MGVYECPKAVGCISGTFFMLATTRSHTASGVSKGFKSAGKQGGGEWGEKGRQR